MDFSKAIKFSAIAIGMMEVPVIHGEYLSALQENHINDPLQLNFIRQTEGDSDSSSDSSSWDDSSSDSSSSDDSSHITPKPSLNPTLMPSFSPSANPSVPPTKLPTLQPSHSPTQYPSSNPTTIPSFSPTGEPSHLPSMRPSENEICDITVNPPLLLGSIDLVESPESILLTGPRQALLPNDNRVITWSTVENGVGTFSWAAIIDSDNDIVISPFKVNDELSFDPRVVALNDGNFIVTWQDNSGPQNIEGQIFQTDGTKIGDAFEITSDAWASQNDIVDQGNGFIASWRQTPGGVSPDPGILKAKLFNRNATVLNAYNISEFDTNGSYRASMASNDNNTVEFVWSSRDDNNIPTLYQKTLILNNGFVSEAQVLSDPSHLGGPSSIAKLSNGNFIVVWGDGSHISAVILDASTGAAGNIFDVAVEHNDQPGNPSVIALPKGTFIVSWEADATNDINQDFSRDFDIYGKLFENSGKACGCEFLLNQIRGGRQVMSKLLSLPNDQFSAAWMSTDVNDDGSLNGVSIGEFLPNSACN